MHGLPNAADGCYGIDLVMAEFYKKYFCPEIDKKGIIIKLNAEINRIASQVRVYGEADKTLFNNFSQDQLIIQ